ncbi:LLM class flavin-dependent oxidoreductase, partial [Rhodococcus sp. R1101]
MTLIGFHASHEQVSPSRLLEDVRLAEAAGFRAAMCSDHIEPWSRRQGHSGFAWSWLGAALATTELRFGVVTATGFRYHPVVTAQATATLASMFPHRFWFALGSGEHCNERMSGTPWPSKEERQQILGENLDIVRRLHAGEIVDHDGAVKVDRGRVWDRPPVPPEILLPALTPETARRFAGRVDGLVTVNAPLDDLRRILDAYRDGGGTGRTVLQVHLSWASTRDRAEAIAREQWSTNALPPELMADL